MHVHVLARARTRTRTHIKTLALQSSSTRRMWLMGAFQRWHIGDVVVWCGGLAAALGAGTPRTRRTTPPPSRSSPASTCCRAQPAL